MLLNNVSIFDTIFDFLMDRLQSHEYTQYNDFIESVVLFLAIPMIVMMLMIILVIFGRIFSWIGRWLLG